jgi:hypothetical protein
MQACTRAASAACPSHRGRQTGGNRPACGKSRSRKVPSRRSALRTNWLGGQVEDKLTHMRSMFDGLRVVPVLWLLVLLASGCDADPVVVLWEADAAVDAGHTSWLDCPCREGSTITCVLVQPEGDGCATVTGTRTCLPDASWGPCIGQSGPGLQVLEAGALDDCAHFRIVCGPGNDREEVINDCSAVSTCDPSDF